MHQDDRERDAPSGGPESSNDRAREDAPQSVDEFENAPSAMRSAEADGPDEPVGPMTDPTGEATDDATASTGDVSVAHAEEISPADAETATRVGESATSQAEASIAEAAGPPPQEAEAYPAAPAPPPAAANAAAHSVPATQVGESTQCPRCGKENRPGVAFCRNCGQRLVVAGVATTVARPGAPEGTQQCPRCGTANRAGVAFCQNCGANLRASAQPAAGYVPPAVQLGAAAAAHPAVAREASGGAVLGPLVLLVGTIGIATAWLLPFPYGGGSLWERSFGAVGGYGIAFWNGYSNVSGGILDKAYFGFAAAAPILAALLLLLALGGFLRAAPGALQALGLLVSTLWAIGLIALFGLLEVAGNWNGDLVSVLRTISPAGIIFLLSGLIVLIGCATRFARS